MKFSILPRSSLVPLNLGLRRVGAQRLYAPASARSARQRLRTRANPWCQALGFAALVGCSAGGGSEAPSGPTADEPTGNGGSATVPGDDGPLPAETAALPPGPGPQIIGQCSDTSSVSIAPTPLRRISRSEYNNAVLDLFADETKPADIGGFPSDELVGSFVSNSVTLLTTTNNEGYLFAAEGVAARAAGRFGELSGCASIDALDCAKGYLAGLARRAFHGTLTAAATSALNTLYDRVAAQPDMGPAAALEAGLRYVLLSPNFLFPLEFGERVEGGATRLSPSEVAGRLATFLWRSVPDAALLGLADSGGLATAEQVRTQASLMLDDPRSSRMLDQFVLEWLDIGESDRIVRDTPSFNTTLRDHMHRETVLFFRNIVQAGVGSYGDLLTASVSLMSPELAAHYGATYPAGTSVTDPDGFTAVSLPDNRRGILLLGAFLATHSQPNRPSQVQRGLAVRERVICDRVFSPPPGVERNPPTNADQTTQQVFDEHANNPSCSVCHQFMDPIGRSFTLYDQFAQYRETENGIALDSTGQILSGLGAPIEASFGNALELTQILATEAYTQQCFAVQVNRFALGRDEQLADACSLTSLWDQFSQDLNLRNLFINITGTDAFLHRSPVRAGEACR